EWQGAVVRAQLDAELVELRVRQPAVVRDDERVGRAQLLGELCDDLFLLCSLHVDSSAPSSRKRLSPPREVGSGTGIACDVLLTYLGRTSAPWGCRLSSAVSVASRLDGSSHPVDRNRLGGVGDIADPRRVEMESRPHRRRQRDALDVAALRCRGLRADDLLEHDGVVLEQLPLAEALL